MFEHNEVALEDLMIQLLISKGFAPFGEAPDAVAAAIQLCCDLVTHIATVDVPAQWN